MKDTALQNVERLDDIRSRLFVGAITYDQAKKEAEPIIAEINKKSVEIAKRYGMKPQLVSFASVMR